MRYDNETIKQAKDEIMRMLEPMVLDRGIDMEGEWVEIGDRYRRGGWQSQRLSEEILTVLLDIPNRGRGLRDGHFIEKEISENGHFKLRYLTDDHQGVYVGRGQRSLAMEMAEFLCGLVQYHGVILNTKIY